MSGAAESAATDSERRHLIDLSTGESLAEFNFMQMISDTVHHGPIVL